MGNNHQNQQSKLKTDPNKLDINQSRFLEQSSPSIDEGKPYNKIKINQFKKLQDWQAQLEGIVPSQKIENTLISQAYFRQQKDMNTYMQTLYSLKQLCDISIFDDIEVKIQKSICTIITKQQVPSNNQEAISRKSIVQDMNKCLDFLIFICKIISKTQNLYISPEQIVQCEDQFYLKGFQYKQYSKSKFLLAYITWLHQENQEFMGDMPTEHIISFNEADIYMREIFFSLKNNKINDQELVVYFTKVKQKMKYLNGNFDSFHACFKAKRARNCTNTAFKEWILTKKHNQIYFYNIIDMHLSQGKIIRKKRKINIENVHLIYNADEFEINFMLQGTKNMVKTSQFEMEDCFTISDIEIKHKFPFKIKNPMMFQRGRQIFMLDQLIYRYNIDQNKLYQESKKISDCLCLVPSVQLNYFVVRLSIDIFRHGIRIYIEDKYEILYPSGNSALSSQLQNIKIDIKHVEFCIEVYKNVFLMKANHNLWILDLNFMCFFSYCPIQRIKEYYRLKNFENDQNMFEILNQPFPVTWLNHQDGLNISIKQDSLYMIGDVMGKLFFLQYKLIFEAGMLKLHRYSPLLNRQSKSKQVSQIKDGEKSYFTFNVYSQNMQILKTNHWIYKGFHFLQIDNLKAIWSKNFVEIGIQTEKVLLNLKEVIEQNKKCNRRWDKYQASMLLHRVLLIFSQITKMNISHKHFSISNILITKKKQLKLKGWSQPSRNWFISDYRDFLLVCFNIITMNTVEKLTDKLIQKHQSELAAYSGLKQRITFSLRNKAVQKKHELEKYLQILKNDFSKALCPLFQAKGLNHHIVSLQQNTPRFSILNIVQTKIKKMVAVSDQSNSHTTAGEQFTFKPTDEYVWNEQNSKLYIFTANYQMFELTINVSDHKQETLVLEEYEYLPQNIIQCSFIYTTKGLFAFGGIARNSKNKILYNQLVYHFDRNKLTWKSVADIGEARLNPQLILSSTGNKVYLMGGQLDCGPEYLQVIEFDTITNKIQKMTDFGCINPLLHLSTKNTYKLFNISQKYSIFMLWTVTSNTYTIKIFSNLIGGMELDFQGKIYLEDSSQIPPASITFLQGNIHFLRPYGKYTKIMLNNLDNLSVVSKILYSN